MCPENLRELEIKKILIIGSASSFYNLLIFPAIGRIRDTFKDAEMEIAAGDSSLDYLSGHPWFSRVIPYGKRPVELLKEARRKRYDLIVSFAANSFLPYFLRGKYRLSFLGKYFFSDRMFTPEAELALEFMEPLLPGDKKPQHVCFPVNRQEREDIDERLRADGLKKSDTLAVIVPGADEGRRAWAPENFAPVTSKLIDTYGAKIILAGPASEKYGASAIKKLIKSGSVYDYTGSISPRSIAALFEKAELLMTCNLAYMHLADAAGCPVVGIFGAGNPYRFGPSGTKNIIVHSDLECFPCKVTQRCAKNFSCLEKISTEQVQKAAMLILDEAEQPLLFDL